ncbi:RICIN domain-containing protein [Pseudochryseolinea flava]|nr:RICIN domain-containing protein [Pseudochryseolinea flava]
MKRKISLSVWCLMIVGAFLMMRCTKDEIVDFPVETTKGIDKKPLYRDVQEIAAVGVGIAGVNWADGRDNFVDGWVIPSGLTASDDYTTVSAKANAILTGFQTNMPGCNAVRLPINPPSVLESWWTAYSGTIDRALSKNMKVVLACWEGASSRNGLIDDVAQFWNMWTAVVNKYGGSSNVYFEVFNEPHGYTLAQLTTIYAEFLSRYPNVPRGRIILGGTGYSENVTGVGADSRFTSCLLALHNYAFWATRPTTLDWEQDWKNRIGSYGARTVVTEFGAAMTTGKNYTGAVNGDNEIAYIQGSTNLFRSAGISSMYWPGLRDNDSYSIQNRGGTGTNITLTTTNASGVTRIRYGWGENVNGGPFNPTAYYRIINRNSGQALDVNGGATTDGAAIIQWPWNGGNNQQWQLVDQGGGYYRIQNRNSGKPADVNGGSIANGATVIQWPWNGGNNQQWQLVDNGNGYYRILNRNSGRAMDVNSGSTANGASVIQWQWNAGNNQQWQIIQQ